MSKFPVPQNFFYCPPLGEEEKTHLSELGENSLIDLVCSSRLQGGIIKWTMDSDENGIQIFYGEDPNGPSDVTLLASTTEVLATFDEISSLYRVETRQAFQDYTRLFAKDLLDAAHLYTISTATPERPRHYSGIRWIVLGSPYPLVANRDYCYLECQDDFEMNGKRGWGRSLTSINLPCCPDFKGSLGTIRASFIRSGFVVLESKRPGYLQIIHALQTDFKGNVPKWVVKIGMKKRARTIGEIDKYLREKRLSARPFLREHELVPKSARSKCHLCQIKFGTFSTKVRCRKCGEVVCGKCNKYWEVQTSKGQKMIRVCSACSITGGKDGSLSVFASGVTPSELSDDRSETSQLESMQREMLSLRGSERPSDSPKYEYYSGLPQRREHQISVNRQEDRSPLRQVNYRREEDQFSNGSDQPPRLPPPMTRAASINGSTSSGNTSASSIRDPLPPLAVVVDESRMDQDHIRESEDENDAMSAYSEYSLVQQKLQAQAASMRQPIQPNLRQSPSHGPTHKSKTYEIKEIDPYAPKAIREINPYEDGYRRNGPAPIRLDQPRYGGKMENQFYGHRTTREFDRQQQSYQQIERYDEQRQIPRAIPLDPRSTPIDPRSTPIDHRVNPLDPRNTPLDARDTPLDARDTPLDARASPLDPRASPLDPQPSPLQPRAAPLEPRVSPLDPQASPLEPRASPLDPRTTPLDPRDSPIALREVPRERDEFLNGHDSQSAGSFEVPSYPESYNTYHDYTESSVPLPSREHVNDQDRNLLIEHAPVTGEDLRNGYRDQPELNRRLDNEQPLIQQDDRPNREFLRDPREVTRDPREFYPQSRGIRYDPQDHKDIRYDSRGMLHDNDSYYMSTTPSESDQSERVYNARHILVEPGLYKQDSRDYDREYERKYSHDHPRDPREPRDRIRGSRDYPHDPQHFRDPRYDPRDDPRYDPRYDSRYDPRFDPRGDSRYAPRYDPRIDPRYYSDRDPHRPRDPRDDPRYGRAPPRDYHDYPRHYSQENHMRSEYSETASIKSDSIQEDVLKAMHALKGDGNPDPQQLLALYKQLQQLNLETVAPVSS